MTTESAGSIDHHDLPIIHRGQPYVWRLEIAEHGYPDLELTLRSPERTWTASGTSVFVALLQLRERLEADGILVCTNGARRNAWASGMQQDMARGRLVYLLDDTPGRPREVHTLDAAPADKVVTVQEQKDFYAAWLTRRNMPEATRRVAGKPQTSGG